MKILIADDNPFYRLALCRTVQEWGFTVVEAQNGMQAFAILSGPDPPKLAILDWVMPGLSGPELCKKVRALYQPEPPYLIILTDLDGKENFVGALEAGADDFVHKPFDRKQLQARLQVGRRIVKLQTGQTLIFTLARAAEAKSPYTKGHSDRVTQYALELASGIGLGENELDLLRRGGLLHDIGKIGIPDSVLNKPGSLTEDEREIIQQHPVLGVEMLKPLQSLVDVLPLIRWHHERCDGKGYPDGLCKNDIPFLVRLLSVADVYDALSSVRPYRKALTREACFSMLRQSADQGGLDPDLVEQFVDLPTEFFAQIAKGETINHFHLDANAIHPNQMVQEIA